MPSELRTLANFIDGRFVPPAAGGYLDDVAPATAEVIARVPRSSASDVDAAVGAAKKAFQRGWGASSVAQRAELCERIGHALRLRQQIGEGRQNARGERDVSRLYVNSRMLGERLQNREQRVRGKGGGFVGLGVDNGRLGGHLPRAGRCH